METIPVIIIAFLLAYGFYLFIQLGAFVFFKKNISILSFINNRASEKFYKSHQSEIVSILSDFEYYKRLPQEIKDLFIKRVSAFIYNREFIPRENDNVTLSQKVRIAASATQLTLGIDPDLLNHFTKIFLFPGPYYSNINKAYHKGEVNLNGAILLSYDDFEKGYNDPDDGINLGLHEMAHALRFGSLLGLENDELFAFYFSSFKSKADNEFTLLQEKSNSILRDYSKANFEEFFAVCIENFFERPGLFKKEFPDLFIQLKLLLNQDTEQSNPVVISQRAEILKEQYIEFIPGNPIFEMAPKLQHMILSILRFLIISVFLLFIFYREVLFYIAVILANLSILLLINKKFKVYNNGLVVSSLLFPNFISQNFPFSCIENVSFVSSRSKIIKIRYLKHNRIVAKSFFWYGANKDLDELIRHLKQLNIKIIQLS